jgi:hypothetical protein
MVGKLSYRKLSGGCEAVCGYVFLFPFLIPTQAFFLPYTADCKVRHRNKLVGGCVRVCGHTFHAPFPYPFAVLPYRTECKVRHGRKLSAAVLPQLGCLTLQSGM